MKHQRFVYVIIGNLIALFILLAKGYAQTNEGYIYGRINTFDNSYQGYIRWGKEESFWHDYFNASKIKNEQMKALINKYQNKRQQDWTDFNWDFSSIWDSQIDFITHQFSCHFGDIKSIETSRDSEIILFLKNGERHRLDGEGYNDIGATLYIEDEELGTMALRWERVESIVFMDAPGNTKPKGGSPLYGTIETYRKGTFTGFIQWDHDERIGEDRLDGDNRDGDISIPFREISYIEKQGDGCLVRTYNQKEFYLTNSNDVDESNRGVIVTIEGFGTVDIPWRYFKSARFEKANTSGPPYSSYKMPRELSGRVATVHGKVYTGRILYDLDEEWNIETLDANDDDVKYMVPFRNIIAIAPKNRDYSLIELKNGQNILLGDTRDVTDENAGLLVFEIGKKDPIFIAWEDVEEILFE